MKKFITEILEDVNADITQLIKYKDNAALKKVFEYSFYPENKFILPETTPPFKRDPAPLGMSPSNFLMEIRRFYVFCREDLKPIKREQLFISLLEGLHPSEADLLLAIKDQNLSRLYPKITKQHLVDCGFLRSDIIEEDSKVKKVKTTKKKEKSDE